jgi:hypothetical protein
MAQEYDNRNTWVLFKNDKGDNPKRPDYTGTEIDANGAEHKIAGWIRESAKGTKFISGTRQPKEEEQSKPSPKQAQSFDDLESDVPF